MNKLAVLAAAIAGLSQLCSASVCTSGTLSGYIGLGSGGCTVGSSTLFNFKLLAGTAGATELPASTVLLSPVGGIFNPGLTTAVSTTSSAGVVQETLFTYQISGSSYTGSSATLSNSSETVDGAVTGLENFCRGGSFGMDGVSGCTGVNGALATVDGAQNMDSAIFRASSLLSVTNDLTIDGGLAGSASGGTLVDQFTASPEPMSVWLTGLGLALAAGGSRVRKIVFRNTGRSHE